MTSVATFGGGTSFDLEAPPAPRRKRRLRPKRRLEPAEAPKAWGEVATRDSGQEAEWLAKFLEGQREEFEQAKQRLEARDLNKKRPPKRLRGALGRGIPTFEGLVGGRPTGGPQGERGLRGAAGGAPREGHGCGLEPRAGDNVTWSLRVQKHQMSPTQAVSLD